MNYEHLRKNNTIQKAGSERKKRALSHKVIREECLFYTTNHILKETEALHVAITSGPQGMVSASKGQENIQHIPTFARDVFDVTGAGDTVIAVLAMMMVAGYSLSRCIEIANVAAGIVVGQIGTANVTPGELVEELDRLHQLGVLKN